jgi:hypothetical protein
VEKHLDEVLTVAIDNLKDMKLPIEPLTVFDYMNNPDMVRYPDSTYVYKLNYNADQLKDKYIKERNIVFPENFTDGFEKYFNEEGIKRVIRKIRKIINKAGGRERHPPKTNIRGAFYLSENAKEGAEEFALKVENFALKYIESPEIKELDPTVFENMKNYILSGMETYYQMKGFSRPLTESRLSMRAISREVTTLIRTAVTSSLPGFQTAQGQQRGYTFNKSVRVNIDTPLGLFEAMYRKNPEAMKIFKFNLNGLLMDQPISETIKNRIINIIDSNDVQLVSSAGFEVREKGNGFLIKDPRIDVSCYYFNTTIFKDFISNLGNQQISINDAIMESGTLICLDTGLIEGMSSMIKESFSEFDEFRRSLEPAGRTGSIYENKVSAPVGLILPRGRRGENIAVVDFIFSFYGKDGTFSKLRLESAEVSIYRRRNLNRTFEIDINADYGFDSEIRRVINRVLNPQDFYSANTNPRERSNRWIIDIVRGLSGMPNVIVIEEPKYDSLTGSTRGMWLIFSEGFGVTYFTIDDSKQGQSASKQGLKMKGSLCIGTASFHYVPGSLESADIASWRKFEHNNKEYIFMPSESNCVNLQFQAQATERDVQRGVAEQIGELINTPAKSKLGGGNVDPMGTGLLTAFGSGNVLGEDANIRAVQEASRVNIPTFDRNRRVVNVGDLQYQFYTNLLLHKPSGVSIEVSDLKTLFRFLNSNFKREEIKERINLSSENLIDDIFNELGITYKYNGFIDDSQTEERMKRYFSKAFQYILRQPAVSVTTIDDIKPAIEANKDIIKEGILRVRLGADYGGETHPDEDYVFLDDLERRKRRKRSRY